MILQEIQAYDQLELLASKVVEGFLTGLHASPFHGFSVEFAEHRPYNSGESIKHMDWKLMARTDKLFVKRYEEETNLRCHILLDVSHSMYFPERTHRKLKFGVLAAAAIANVLKRQRDACSLTLFSDQVIEQTACKSSAMHYRSLISKLQPYWSEKTRPLEYQVAPTALHTVLEQMAYTTKRRSLIILLSDLIGAPLHDEAFFKGLQHLQFGKSEVIVFRIREEVLENQLEISDKPIKLIDLESGDFLKVDPNELKNEYAHYVAQFDHQLRTKCLGYGIDYHSVDTAKDFRQILLPFFAHRTSMM